MSAKVYEIVTDRIIQMLDKGTVPWQKPWASRAPANYVSGKPYRGINVWLLSCCRYTDHRFITMKQVNEKGGRVKKGEKAHLVVFWSPIKKTEMTPEGAVERKFFLLRYYYVFNVEQTEGWTPKPLPSNDTEKVQSGEAFMAKLPEQPKIVTGGDEAFYRPATDEITMPPINAFRDSAAYYSTLFHEVTHWTGAQSRLKRLEKSANIEAYSKEELVAEMGAAYCCGICGIENAASQKNTAAYIQNWASRIKGDAKLVVQAAAQAQRAVDWMQGVTFNSPADEPKTEELAQAE